MYSLDFNLALGAGNTGLTLEAVIVDTTGTPVGAAITTGFAEIGGGNYLWHATAIPDGHRGGVTFQVSPAGAIKAFAAVNPEEVENPDVKTSTRSSHAAADIWAAGTRTLTSAAGPSAADVADAVWDEALAGHATVGSAGAALSDAGAGSLTAAEVWAHTPRTLTQTAAQVAAALAGSVITAHRGDTLSVSLTGLGSIANRDKLWWTVKARDNDTDAEAVIQIEETAGLLRLNGAAGTAGQGSLVVDDEDAGDVTITLAAAATAALRPWDGYSYDVQQLVGTVVETLTEESFAVTADQTRSVS